MAFLKIFLKAQQFRVSQTQKKKFGLKRDKGMLTKAITDGQLQKVTRKRVDAAMGTCVVITQQCLGCVTSQKGGHWGKNLNMRVTAQ